MTTGEENCEQDRTTPFFVSDENNDAWPVLLAQSTVTGNS